MTTATVQIDIRQFELSDLETWFLANDEKRFRAKQVYEWLWQKGAHDFEEMTNLSKDLREKLSDQFIINAITEDTVQYSDDGTIKFRFKLHDGHMIESVLIPVVKSNRFTVCVSSQVGCSLNCTFCATGKMKRVRNLDAAEIYDQVLLVSRVAEHHFSHPLTNIVYMGMGEPLLAYKNVLKSVEHISSPEGLHMSPRRITISTAGIAKMIIKLANDEVRFNLALSLHAADDIKRNEIMPINETNNLATLMDAIEYFYKKTKNRISYEYVALSGVNDTIEDARNLVKLCKRFPVRLNIIEYNSIGDGLFEKSESDTLDRFAEYLTDHEVTVTVRRSRGKDIDAACGQLANKE